jgi:hypothetical protein
MLKRKYSFWILAGFYIFSLEAFAKKYGKVRSPSVVLDEPSTMSIGLGVGSIGFGANGQMLLSPSLAAVGYVGIFSRSLVLGGEAQYFFDLDKSSRRRGYVRSNESVDYSYDKLRGKLRPYIGAGLLMMPVVGLYGLGGVQYQLTHDPIAFFGHINLNLSGFGASATLGARYIL